MIVRSITTFLMWLSYLTILVMMHDELGNAIIALAGVLMIPLAIASAAMWDSFKEKEPEKKATQEVDEVSFNREKRKRDMLDSILRDLSDEQLAALKERLSEPDFEDDLQGMIGDDGELIMTRRSN
ncbi:hypothetical protein G4Y79_00810 [Phototrophicus methaneseepsis]|uniref:Uncharacterized protein n=1 Tax=Phototrophicus methaneseepsis TaxID=2710758 RepID=A0A7S8E9P8_9CHLR|nr:hypothetical protein [Phototrophicus methaneseepsis]QPC82946.1 hypothetical protein G4Y79_00810 [Phototrophicus methaneseepsis]